LVQATGDFPEEHRKALGDRIYGCDDCQDVCPINRRSATPTAAPEPDVEARVDLVALLEADDDALLAAHGRWYVPRRDPRYLRRNALVALGNTARRGDPRVASVLHRYLDGDDDLLRRHAAWAARQWAAR
jgi:epoxyqueuosine reductase